MALSEGMVLFCALILLMPVFLSFLLVLQVDLLRKRLRAEIENTRSATENALKTTEQANKEINAYVSEIVYYQKILHELAVIAGGSKTSNPLGIDETKKPEKKEVN